MAENTREHSIREKLLYREEPTGMEFLGGTAENTARDHTTWQKLLYREEPTGMEFLEDGREHS